MKRKLSRNITKIEIKYSRSLLNNGSHFISLIKTFGKLYLSKTYNRSKSNFTLIKNNIYFNFKYTTLNNNSFAYF